MGNFIARLFRRIFPDRSAEILIIGLDSSGKSTLVRYLSNEAYGGQMTEDTTAPMPTIGYSHRSISLGEEYGGLNINTWDIGGQTRLRSLWRHYYSSCDAIIYVIDSSDVARFDIAKKELFKMLNDPDLNDCPLLVLANKVDRSDSVSVNEVHDALDLTEVSLSYHIEATSAVEGTGVMEAFKWMADQLQSRN
ncbi:hypothetical protein PCE1_000094 [Barthelona sp. PCE]